MSGYLGDDEKKVVHHLANIKDECNIYEIKMDKRKYFTPDTQDNAKSQGFELCKFCN
ncbi:MAG: hypothetical protein R3327_02845 [Nitrosopumilaceae archaeon]|nr:hypothetical protein [Nitrosopumilaceae archaeon]